MIDTDDFKIIENILLGDNHFNTLQKEFIELYETKTIVAGPGAGKTTALAAKIVLLMKRLIQTKSRDGVCIITHTNVAVSEIKSVLRQAGIAEVKSPHFIGTIHEFFNRFCVLPYFKNVANHNNFIFSKNNETDKKFYKEYLGKKIPWLNREQFRGVKDAISNRVCYSELFLNKETKYLDLRNTTNWDKFDKYKKVMFEAKVKRKIQGFLTYDDTFLFSDLFLLNSYFKEILRRRFKYVFLDEYQDTAPYGAYLLDELFSTENNVFQKIGDPYQTITYDQPMPEIVEEEVLQMNISNRFGIEIAEPLNVIMPNSKV